MLFDTILTFALLSNVANCWQSKHAIPVVLNFVALGIAALCHFIMPSMQSLPCLQAVVLLCAMSVRFYSRLQGLEWFPFHTLVSFVVIALPRGGSDLFGWVAIGITDDFHLTAFSAFLAVCSAGVLVLWSVACGHEHGPIQDVLAPQLNRSLIRLSMFSVVNALLEEIDYRGIIMNGMGAYETATNSVLVPYDAYEYTTDCRWLIMNSIVAFNFAFHHYIGGFPCGLSGLGLVFVWGWLLGLLRSICGGLGLVLGIHIVADFTIGCLVMYKDAMDLKLKVEKRLYAKGK